MYRSILFSSSDNTAAAAFCPRQTKRMSSERVITLTLIISYFAELENHQDLVHSFCWKGDGSLLATTSKVSDFILSNLCEKNLCGSETTS